jgi:DNA repair exonuclease SbcCD ATPase subunit
LNIELPADKTALVLGQNLDDSGADSNGAGKSSLFDVISWAIWGKVPRGDDFTGDILRRGADHATASLTLMRGDDELVITRERGKKSVLKATVVRGAAQTDLTLRTATLTQKAICRYLGYDERKGFDDYLSQIYFSAMSGRGFLSAEATPAERQQVLERFMGLGSLDVAAQLVKDDLKADREALAYAEATIASMHEQIAAYGDPAALDAKLKDILESLGLARTNLEAKKSARTQLDEYVRQSREIASTYSSAKDRYQKVVDEARRLAAQYERATVDNQRGLELRAQWERTAPEYEGLRVKVDEVKDQIVGLERDKAAAHAEMMATRSELQTAIDLEADLRSQVDHAQACPYCSQSLMVSHNKVAKFDMQIAEQRLADAQAARASAQAKLEQLENAHEIKVADLLQSRSKLSAQQFAMKKMIDLKAQVDALDLSGYDQLIVKVNQMQAAYDQAKADMHSATEKHDLDTVQLVRKINMLLGEHHTDLMSALNTAVADTDDEINGLQRMILHMTEQKGATETSLARLSELGQQLGASESAVAAKRERAAQLVYWSKIYPEIKRKIIDSFVPLFESQVNEYLSELEIAERIRFVTEVDKRSGDGTKIGFAIEVFDGQHWANYSSYSGGEKSRIMVAVGFGLRRLALQRAAGTTLGYLLVDELLDNIDSTGMTYFFALLNKIEGQKFLITHTKIDDIVIDTDYRLIVSKENGRSSVAIGE